MKYITYKEFMIGGLGHSFNDWISCYILSKLLNYPFIFEKMPVWSNQDRNMDVSNSSDKYFWNDYLNLKDLDIIDKSELDLSNYKQIPIVFKSWTGTDIEKIINFIKVNNDKYSNIIYYFNKNTRMYLIDLYYYDIKNKTSLTSLILKELNNAYYSKHEKIKKEQGEKKIINIYLRYGDLRTIRTSNNIVVTNNFELTVLKKLTNELCVDDCVINVISAGKVSDLVEIKNNFAEFNNINYLFNIEQDKAFHLMTQSDYLIFSQSTFPFTASLYCEGQVYICKNTLCHIPYKHKKVLNMIPRFVNNNINFFDNYHIE